MVSKVVPSTSTVRHSDAPQTEQQGLLPTLAPSHSSIGLPAIQMRLDFEGFALNDLSSISLISRVGSMPNGRRDCLSFSNARCISRYVALQRSHVLPSELTSLCQRIGSGFIGAISFFWHSTTTKLTCRYGVQRNSGLVERVVRHCELMIQIHSGAVQTGE